MRLRLAFILCVLTGCSSQSQPSLKETVDWMAQSLALHNGQRFDSDLSKSSEVKLVNKLAAHGCKLEYTVTNFEMFEYDLSDIDPDSIKQETIGKGFWVTFKTRDFNHSVRYVHPTEPKNDYDSESGGFALDSSEVAASFLKALHRAVDLCGGKPSTF